MGQPTNPHHILNVQGLTALMFGWPLGPKGVWRVTLTQGEKTSVLELKRGFLEDYFASGEYQQEMAFAARINKALRELK
jgi:hypothetical protein